MYHCQAALLLTLLFMQNPSGAVDGAADPSQPGDRLVAEYFATETKKLSDSNFAEIETLQDWEVRRDEYRRELHEMLGLEPLPERTDLQPVITGMLESEEFVVEKLHFQSQPGLYVTANLYRPKEVTEPLPAVLYLCGHGGEKAGGVSVGNKTHYQHHGAWFARNGYVCLIIDTIQLGEIEGVHHGTYRHGMWWWNNRGYTPAGVEAWNSIRAIDYLQSRPEVDPDRIGATGRSGGGAYTWWVAALDERIQVAVPVAGITNLQNYVVDGCVEGHCDCMFMVNTYRWDYAKLAALVAPRPLLISNTDKDPIFPLDGVVDIYTQVREIYKLYDAESKLGLNITEGPHMDTQELRVHAFRWFNRFLKNDDSLIEKVATPFFKTAELRVLDELPDDERVTTIHDTFVSEVASNAFPQSDQEFEKAQKTWLAALQNKCFRGWPELDSATLDAKVVSETERDDYRVRAIEYTSQAPYRLTLFVIDRSPTEGIEEDNASTENPTVVRVLDQQGWDDVAPALAFLCPNILTAADPSAAAWNSMRETLTGPVVFIAPRGVGPTAWSTEEKTQTHIRRRFMLLGQTAASMQIYDVRRALQATEQLDGLRGRSRNLTGARDAAVWALYASLFENHVSDLNLVELPIRNRDAPDILNVSRYVEMPQVVMLAAERVEQLTISATGESLAQWQATEWPDFSDDIVVLDSTQRADF